MSEREYWAGSDIVFNCLIDKKRVLALRKAIKKVVKHGDVVVDLGSGTGILSLFAVDYGAKRVYAVENDGNLYKFLEKNFKINSYRDKIILIKGDARKIKLPEKVDVVICEMIATGLIDELQIPALNNILKFVKNSVRIIPQAMQNYVELVYSNDIFYGHRLQTIRYEYVYRKDLKSTPFSRRVEYTKTFFNKKNNGKINKKIILIANKVGYINGIRISNDTVFPDGSSLGDSLAYCIPMVLPIEKVKVNEGDRFILKLSYRMCEGLKGLEYSLKKI